MTVEQEVANLTSSINALTDTVNVRRATLDAAVADAEQGAGEATTQRQLAETARGGAEAALNGSTQVYADVLTALQNVDNLDAVYAALFGGVREVVAANDVVSVCIYDTSKDSDGGAWRKRCQHTSWYNEALNTATRGSRREFPSKVLIVGQNSTGNRRITIFDCDSVDVPMWMVFNSGVGAAVAFSGMPRSAIACNGRLYGAMSDRLSWVDFLTDKSFFALSTSGTRLRTGGIASRNDSGIGDTVGGGIVNSETSDVTAIVLPGTPVDPVTKLPRPTIAVGTAGGASVIHWDGRVTNSASTVARTGVSFGPDGTLWIAAASGGLIFSTPLDYAAPNWPTRQYSGGFPAPFSMGTPVVVGTPSGAARGGTQGLSVLQHVPASGLATGNQNNGSALAQITSAFNTGHMVGDIKLALAESTADVTSLVGTEIVTNGGPGFTSTTGWESNNESQLSLDDGKLVCSSTISGRFEIRFGVPSQFRGKAVVIEANVTHNIIISSGVSDVVGRVSAASGSAADGAAVNLQGSTRLIVPDNADRIRFVSVNNIGVEPGSTITVHSLSMRLAATDRSVAANHPRVVGTVARTPVASGAELAAYRPNAGGGFEVDSSILSGTGTGDFCFRMWLAGDNAGSGQNILRIRNAADSANAFFFDRDTATGDARLACRVPGAFDLQSLSGFKDERFKMVTLLRRSGTVELWVNDRREATGASSTDLTSAFADTLHILKSNVSLAATSMRVASFSFSRTAPTPAQIRRMYEDERHLFQPGAKCLLPGSNVSALSYDDSTDLLHVATTAGSARMRGLLVVDKDATVYTGIDAKDGYVATRDANSADIALPAAGLREKLMGHNGGPPLYDRNSVKASGVTTNATPTVIARFPMAKGEFGQWVIRTVAREYGDGAELAAYEHVLLARRPGEGNVAISGSVTERVIQEVTSSMAVSITANTTTQCIEVTATGVASKNIEWTVEGRLA